jgi:hypothetical protein
MSVFSPWTRQIWKKPAALPATPASRPKRKEPDRRPAPVPKPIALATIKPECKPEREPETLTLPPAVNLPRELPKLVHSVVGQDANMNQLCAWFATPNYRAVVMWGASGVGKTMAAYSLSPHVVEFNALSTNIFAELHRSLRACSPVGRLVVLLNGVDEMPGSALADISKVMTLVNKSRSPINPLVITCAALHLVPECLKTDSLVLHFARLQPAAMRSLLSASVGVQNHDAVIAMANGDARQAILIATYNTSMLGGKDLAASPFQMVHAVMNTFKSSACSNRVLDDGMDVFRTKQPFYVNGKFQAPRKDLLKVIKPNFKVEPTSLESADDGFRTLFEDFEASIFVHYLVPRNQVGERPPRADADPQTKTGYLQRRVWPFEEDFVNLAPDLSDWYMLYHGRTLQQDVQTLALYELPSLVLKNIISRFRQKPREVMHVSDHTKIFHRKAWDPDESLKIYMERRRMN